MFVLMGIAHRLAKATGKDSEAIRERMASGDYRNAVNTLEEEFSEYVDIYGALYRLAENVEIVER